MSITIKRIITLDDLEAEGKALLVKKVAKKKATKKTVKKSASKKVVKKDVKKKAVKKVAPKKKVATKRSLKYKTPQSLQGRRSHDNGNNFEREVVKFFSYLHAVRVGGMNDNALRKSFDVYMSRVQGVPSDGVNPTVVIECKLRKKLSVSEAVKFLNKLKARFEGKDVFPLLCWKIGKQRGFFVCYMNTAAGSSTFTIVPSVCIKRNTSVFEFASVGVADE